MGVPELRQAVAAHSGRHAGVDVDDWAGEALITVGATEALSAAFLALLNTGDEVERRFAVSLAMSFSLCCIDRSSV